MRLFKDKTGVKYNDFLTLDGIPAVVFDYRLGNRSALEWVIDQYRVKTDEKRSGIVNDPNREDDEEYIVRLVGKVVAVSLETVEDCGGVGRDQYYGLSGGGRSSLVHSRCEILSSPNTQNLNGVTEILAPAERYVYRSPIRLTPALQRSAMCIAGQRDKLL